MEATAVRKLVEETWDSSIVPSLHDYIRIPNKSPLFDPDWEKNGHMDRAVDLIAGWCREQKIEGLTVEVVKLEGRTPLIYMEVPGEVDDTVMLYGHLDKQPEMVGWAEGLDPWTPVLRGERLYGRGGADDGYAAYSSLTSIRALQEQNVPHARCVILIEGCEESGSYDLPHYIEHLADRIGQPSLVVCLDSGCGNYDQLWCTTSLRGLVGGELKVRVLHEGVHSGDASGIVPSSFRVIRQLLARLERLEDGQIMPEAFRVEIPPQRLEQAEVAARVLGDDTWRKFPFVEGMHMMASSGAEAILNRTWRPFLEITGAEGLPDLAHAGNVLRPYTAVKLSLRIPPMCDPEAASAALKEIMESDPPYGAQVTFTPETAAPGWNAPELAEWLGAALERGSRTYFGREAVHMGEGGSIPFMGLLGEIFPQAQFLITGVLGPNSNAHGPNEFLDIPCGKKVTACVSEVLKDHAQRPR